MSEGGETYSRAVALGDDILAKTIADVEALSDEDKRFPRDAIEEGDRDIAEGRESSIKEVFARLLLFLPTT